MIDLTIEKEDVLKILIYRSDLKRDMLKELGRDDILRETIRYGIVGHDGKVEEGIGGGVNGEVLADFICFFDWRSGFDPVQNIV